MKKLIFGLGILTASLTCSIASANNTICDACFKGSYLGGNIGVISHVANLNEQNSSGIGQGVIDGKTFIATDFTGGFQAGYDWNCGYSLLGIVGDWDWSNVKQSYSNEELPSTSDYIKTALNWYSTIRGRAGITAGNFLLYLTAGAVVAHFKNTWSTFNWTATRWSWTAGVGAEIHSNKNVSVGIDLLYMNFPNLEKTFVSNVQRVGRYDSVWVARVILNYHLGNLFNLFCCK